MLLHTTSSLARRFNAAESPNLQRTDGSAWNQDKVRRFLEAVGVKCLPRKVDVETGKEKGKIRYTEKAIKDAIPEFWEALLDDEKRIETARTIAQEQGEPAQVHVHADPSGVPA